MTIIKKPGYFTTSNAVLRFDFWKIAQIALCVNIFFMEKSKKPQENSIVFP